MKNINFAKITIATGTIVICAVIVGFLPPPWEGTSGRDFRPQATIMAIFIFLASLYFRSLLKWPLKDLIIAILIVEILILAIINYFSGYGFDLFNSFNMLWLLYMNVYTGLPWVIGLSMGSLWNRIKDRG